MENKKKLVIIDSNALIHRAFHALPPLTAKKGELVNAVYGFLLVFFKVVDEIQPDYIVACFDFPAPTFRHKKYKDYKAKRPPTPKELYRQIPKVKQVLRAFDVPIFEKQGYEADDLIGTVAQLKGPEIEGFIITGDLDTLQLVDRSTRVYTLGKGVKDVIIYDEAKVNERYQGVTPEQVPDMKGLKGDASDNIPGVAGIGEKTASQLIKQFKSLENLYKHIENAGLKPRVLSLLKGYKEQAFLSRMLATIKRDIPLDFELKKALWVKYDKEKAIELLEKFNFFSLVKHFRERSNHPRQPKLKLF